MVFVLSDTMPIRIGRKTARDLRRICGKLQGEDGFHTSYDNGLQEVMRFWNEYHHLEKEIREKLIE